MNHSGNRKFFNFLNSCLHLIICTRHVRVTNLLKFRSILVNFPVLERYAFLSGFSKMKLAKPKIKGTPTVGLISRKRGLYLGDPLIPVHHLPVPGGKLLMGTKETFLVYQDIIFELVVPSQPWCDPLFETCGAILCLFTTPVGATHCF